MLNKIKEKYTAYCEKHSFKPKSLLSFVVILLVVVIGLGFLSFKRTIYFSKPTSLGLKDIGELATQAGYFTTVQTIDKSRNLFNIVIPGTQSRYVYSYDGTIKAGIDFSNIELEVNDEKHVITVHFPKFRILSTEIDEDSFILYNDGANPFTTLHLEDVDKANAELKKTAQETAIKNGIFENARTNAEVLVRGFLASIYDLNVYTIEFQP
ncbi:MAG: DUF4230 domain-containing protein [Oscillospiraceae bacterium]|nr:DUF4230 domain-containing protein [Oscillospiraceae bacterium]